MVTVQTVCDFLAEFAPPQLAQEWDNVGLLVGDPAGDVQRLMTCLTITPASAAEAVERGAELIVTHHPLPFRPLQRLTTASTPGRLLWTLARAGVAVYSPHTALDSAAQGINDYLARGLGLESSRPLTACAGELAHLGAGRQGRLAGQVPLRQFAEGVKKFLKIPGLQVVGPLEQPVQRIAIACGSGGSLLEAAVGEGCDVLVTGETNFHTCLEAEAQGVALVLTGHYASERCGVEMLAGVLSRKFAGTDVWASERERDPLNWL
jgi:dinuclear metal center YbgI/SA1388 family protein